ncbi:hypothetical protein [Nonomuraea sp. NPDC050310]|uniref:hypothetical protein n=1 Tax=Nonomuraea sp. NPDC050310 TaxID=3154935 RepID=UPI0033CBCE43
MKPEAAATLPSLRVPYVIAYSGELVSDPIHFVKDYRPFADVKLSYAEPRPGDYAYGVLRARARMNRQGKPEWRKLNPRRQWRCMDKLWCQVCGKPATDQYGRIPWILTETVFRWDEQDTAITSAPPTCWACIPESLTSCPRLRTSSVVYTAGYALPVGVLGQIYDALFNGEVIPTEHRNVEVRLKDQRLLSRVLAHQLIVRVFDLQAVSLTR